MDLAAGQMEANRIAEGIDQGVDFGAQPAARPPDRLVNAGFFGAGTVLMGAHDGAVDHRVFIVRVGGQMQKNSFPDTSLGPTAEAAVILNPAVGSTIRPTGAIRHNLR
jgi:hypothetical protein